MTTQKTVVVVGATGNQGGSVIDALLLSGKYHLRGISRNPASEKAKALSSRGVEVVQGNLDDKHSLIKAFRGAYAIYAVTDFFEPFSKHGPKKAGRLEIIHAKNIANAAAETTGLSHYIWSTLPSSAKVSVNKYHTPHFESKAFVDEYIMADLPDLASITTFLWNGYYGGNMASPPFTPNLIKTSGKYGWIQPVAGTTPITTIGDERKNIGVFVEAILRQPELTRGEYVFAEVETLTNQELLERWGKVTGKPTVYIPTSLKAYDTLFPNWGVEMGVMLQFWEEVREKSWSKPGVTVLRKEDLGIDPAKLRGLNDTLATMDWSNV